MRNYIIIKNYKKKKIYIKKLYIKNKLYKKNNHIYYETLIAFIGAGGGGGGGGGSLLGRSLFVSSIIGSLPPRSSSFSSSSESEGSHLAEIHHSGISLLGLLFLSIASERCLTRLSPVPMFSPIVSAYLNIVLI